MSTDRKILTLLVVVWLGFALVQAQLFASGILREPIEEVLGFLNLDKHRHGLSVLVLAAIILIPLMLILRFHKELANITNQLTPRGRAVVRNNAGLALFQQGDYPGALTEFSEAVRLDPQLGAAHANRGIASLQLDQLDEAHADLDTAITLVPHHSDALCWRGQLWFKKGHVDRALADYDEVLRHQPHHLGALIQRGLLRAKTEDFSHALEDLDRAVVLSNQDASLYAIRGSILIGMEDYDRALENCNEAIRRGNTKAQDFSNRGMAWLGLGEYDRAIVDFNEAIRLDPSDGLPFNNRGVASLKQGDYASAALDFDEAMRLTPTLPNSYKNLAWLMATCPEAKFRNGTQAVAYAHHALSMVNEKVVAWFGILAAAYAELGNFDEAVRWQTRCLDGLPANKKPEQEARLNLFKARQPYREYPDGMIQSTAITPINAARTAIQVGPDE